MIYYGKKLSFEDLLQKDGSVSIHHRNLRTGFQRLKFSYFYRRFSCKTKKSIQYEEQLIFCYASCQNDQLWIRKFVIHSITSHMKESYIVYHPSINEFQHVIKTWKPDLCSCRLYLQNIGYMQSAK